MADSNKILNISDCKCQIFYCWEYQSVDFYFPFTWNHHLHDLWEKNKLKRGTLGLGLKRQFWYCIKYGDILKDQGMSKRADLVSLVRHKSWWHGYYVHASLTENHHYHHYYQHRSPIFLAFSSFFLQVFN